MFRACTSGRRMVSGAPARRGRSTLRGFTLIEILVVVAIIALLIAILMPSLAAARAASRSTQCLTNLHQFNLAFEGYAASNKDWVPRGARPTELNHWTLLVAKMLGDKTVYRNVNQLKVAGRPVYQCPERARTQPRPFVDYVVNALDPKRYELGPSGNWMEKKYIRLSVYKRPADVIHNADAERVDKSDPDIQAAYDSYYNNDWNDPATWSNVNLLGIDTIDVWRGAHLPELNTQTPNVTRLRRVAREMHQKRFTNAGFVDGHAAPLQLARKELPDTEKYATWLRRFGVYYVDNLPNGAPGVKTWRAEQ